MRSKSTQPLAPESTNKNSAAAQQRSRRHARRQRHLALWALVIPLLFTTVIALGLMAMFYKRMEFFRPAHAAARSACVALIQAGASPRQTAQT